jgi:hypothetical protein
LTACGNTVLGSGDVTTWEMANTDFTRLEISHGFQADVLRSDTFRVTITIDRAIFEYLVVEQHGDTLHIGLENGNTYLNADRSVVIHLPELDRLYLSGGSRADVGSFSTGHSVEFRLSGGSIAALDNITVGGAQVNLSGGSLTMNNGSMSLSGASVAGLDGSGQKLDLNGSGASDFRLENFTVTTASISLSGASTAAVHITDRLDVDLSGASVIDYTGSPLLGEINLSGGSTVNQK